MRDEKKRGRVRGMEERIKDTCGKRTLWYVENLMSEGLSSLEQIERVDRGTIMSQSRN